MPSFFSKKGPMHMDDRARTHALFGFAPARRLLHFACAPVAADALLYGICLKALGEPISAAFAAKSVLMLAMLGTFAYAVVMFPRQGRSDLPQWWEIWMRLLLAAAIVGLLGSAFASGYAFLAAAASRPDAALVALAVDLVFAVGTLAFVRKFAARAFDLRALVALPAVVAQAAGIACVYHAANPAAASAVTASIATILAASPFLWGSGRKNTPSSP